MEKSAHFVEERVEISGSQLDVTPERVVDLTVRAEHAFATNDAAAEDRGRVVEHDDVHFRWHWFWDTGNGDIGNQGPNAGSKPPTYASALLLGISGRVAAYAR